MNRSAMTTTVSQTPPKTPTAKITDASARIQTPSPGTWKHPRMAEIARRRKASVFDKSNARRICYNLVALFGTFSIPSYTQTYLPSLLAPFTWASHLLGSYHWLPMVLLRLLVLYNISMAAMPLFREPDSLSDIPLSPSQRQLLGLDPASGRPGTPKTAYITPPRYQRSTPRSQSPASGRDGGSGLRASGQKDNFSPGGSPLWARTVAGENRRSSLGRESPLVRSRSGLRESFGESSIFAPGTPSPSRGSTPGLALNSRWLYERRSSSGTRN